MTFTEAEYLTRRAQLNGDLADAEARYNTASLKLATGVISKEEAAAVAGEAETIRMELKGLEAARAEAGRLEGLEAADALVRARREAAKRVQSQEDKAESAFRAILDHAAAFEPLLGAYSSALLQIAAELRKNRDLYGANELGEAIRALNDRDRERLLIEGKLFDAGFAAFAIGHQQIANQAREWEASGGLVLKRAVIRSLIKRLRGEEA